MSRPWTRVRKATIFDDEPTVDLAAELDAFERRALVAENRLLGAVTKVDAVLGRTKDRRHRDDLLDIRLRLTGGTL
jgi:hypothetical protein